MPDQLIQKQITEWYVLFPEYKDPENELSAPYMKQVDVNYMESPMPKIYLDLIEELDFFRYEQADRYYDAENLKAVSFPFDTLSHPQPSATLFANLKSHGFANWRSVIGEEHEVMRWQGRDLEKDIVVKCEERNRIDTPELKVHAVLYAHDDTIVTTDGVINFVNTKRKNEQHSIRVERNLKALYEWFSQNRLPERQFCLDDKHGENGKGVRTIPGEGLASALECDAATAQQLLHRAIGTSDPKGHLWYADARNGKSHIFFYNQNTSPTPSFHGFHVKEGEKNFECIDQDKLSKIYP